MLRASLSFFTRLPVGTVKISDNLSGIAFWMPIVGLIIGIIVSLFLVIFLSLGFSPIFCGFFACIAWIIITGGLHLDGVADCGDGLIAETNKDKRLEIMRDPHVGTFGIIFLFCILTLKTICLITIAHKFQNGDLFKVILLISIAPVIARSLVYLAMQHPLVHKGGLWDMFKQDIGFKEYFFASITSTILCILNGLFGFLALILSIIWAKLFLIFSEKKIGGVNGDICGFLIESSECLVLTIICLSNF